MSGEVPHNRAPTHQLSTVTGQPPEHHPTCMWDSQENSFRYKYSYKFQVFRGKQEQGGAPSSSHPPRPPCSSPPAQVCRGAQVRSLQVEGQAHITQLCQGSLVCCAALCWVGNKEGTWATTDSAAATDPARLAYGSWKAKFNCKCRTKTECRREKSK